MNWTIATEVIVIMKQINVKFVYHAACLMYNFVDIIIYHLPINTFSLNSYRKKIFFIVLQELLRLGTSL